MPISPSSSSPVGGTGSQPVVNVSDLQRVIESLSARLRSHEEFLAQQKTAVSDLYREKKTKDQQLVLLKQQLQQTQTAYRALEGKLETESNAREQLEGAYAQLSHETQLREAALQHKQTELAAAQERSTQLEQTRLRLERDLARQQELRNEASEQERIKALQLHEANGALQRKYDEEVVQLKRELAAQKVAFLDASEARRRDLISSHEQELATQVSELSASHRAALQKEQEEHAYTRKQLTNARETAASKEQELQALRVVQEDIKKLSTERDALANDVEMHGNERRRLMDQVSDAKAEKIQFKVALEQLQHDHSLLSEQHQTLKQKHAQTASERDSFQQKHARNLAELDRARDELEALKSDHEMQTTQVLKYERETKDMAERMVEIESMLHDAQQQYAHEMQQSQSKERTTQNQLSYASQDKEKHRLEIRRLHLENDAFKEDIRKLRLHGRAANAQRGIDFGEKTQLKQELELSNMLVQQYAQELKLVREERRDLMDKHHALKNELRSNVHAMQDRLGDWTGQVLDASFRAQLGSPASSSSALHRVNNSESDEEDIMHRVSGIFHPRDGVLPLDQIGMHAETMFSDTGKTVTHATQVIKSTLERTYITDVTRLKQENKRLQQDYQEHLQFLKQENQELRDRCDALREDYKRGVMQASDSCARAIEEVVTKVKQFALNTNDPAYCDFPRTPTSPQRNNNNNNNSPSQQQAHRFPPSSSSFLYTTTSPPRRVSSSYSYGSPAPSSSSSSSSSVSQSQQQQHNVNNSEKLYSPRTPTTTTTTTSTIYDVPSSIFSPRHAGGKNNGNSVSGFLSRDLELSRDYSTPASSSSQSYYYNSSVFNS